MVRRPPRGRGRLEGLGVPTEGREARDGRGISLTLKRPGDARPLRVRQAGRLRARGRQPRTTLTARLLRTYSIRQGGGQPAPANKSQWLTSLLSSSSRSARVVIVARLLGHPGARRRTRRRRGRLHGPKRTERGASVIVHRRRSSSASFSRLRTSAPASRPSRP